MAKRIGRNANISDEAVLSNAIAVSGAASTTILAANSVRFYVAITVLGQDTWIKFQAASVDNTKKGILIPKGTVYELNPDNMYIGEISAISDVVVGSQIYVVEL